VFAILLVLLLGAGAAGAYWKFVMLPAEDGAAADGQVAGGGRGGDARGPIPVEAAEVEIAPAELRTQAVGSMISNESVVLRPEIAGRIARINFEEGRKVTAGQVMVELDASVERAQLAEAEAQLELATANLERARELRRSNVGTQRALDEAQAQQRTGMAAVDLAKARLAKLTLTAPFDAMAGLRQVSRGDFVTAGAAIVNLEQIEPLKVDFRIPEIFLPKVLAATGGTIDIRLDAFPGESFKGRVYAVNPLVDAQGRAIAVRAQVDNMIDPESGQPRLRPGLFARVDLTLSQQQDAVWVAEEALVPEGNRQFVFKVVPGADGQTMAKRAEVTLGHRRDGKVQLTSGAAKGDIIVVAGVTKVRDEAPVVVQSAPAPEAPPTTAGSMPAERRTARGEPMPSRG
jgi:membrane fusion protein (multidrug efflux system)